jgi:hypothetical protein
MLSLLLSVTLLTVYNEEVVIVGGGEKMVVREVASSVVVSAACHTVSDDCNARAKYVCEANGLTPLGHGGIKKYTFAMNEGCSGECLDGTTWTCGPQGGVAPRLEQQ